jgi:hypothetical protein
MGQGGIVRSSTQKIAGQDATMHRAGFAKRRHQQWSKMPRIRKQTSLGDRRGKGDRAGYCTTAGGRGAKVVAMNRAAEPVTARDARFEDAA